MATKINHTNIAERIRQIAADVIQSNGTNKGLFHTGAVMAAEHANKTGDYTNTIVPLVIASRSFSANLANRAIGFFERTTKVRFNRDNLSGGKLRSLFDKGTQKDIEKLFVWDKEAKPEAIDTNKRWDTYTRPDQDKGVALVDVSAKLQRLVDSLQDAINSHTAIGADGKPVKLATIQKMIKESAEKLTLPVKLVEAKTSDGKSTVIVKREEKPEAKAKPTRTRKPRAVTGETKVESATAAA